MSVQIKLQNVGVRYKLAGSLFSRSKYFQALQNVNIEIKKGETLGIVGLNGAGKSTLLRLMAGVIRPDSGGVNIYDATISLLSLQVGFDVNLTGRDNAIFSGIIQGKHLSEVKDKINEIKSFSELGSFFDEPVRTYSSGMRARLGFSISNTLRPDVLLIDEVLGVGDMSFRKKAENAMAERLKSTQTVVLVSHSIQQIERVCDRAILIDNKTVRAEGDPKVVSSKYREIIQKGYNDR